MLRFVCYWNITTYQLEVAGNIIEFYVSHKDFVCCSHSQSVATQPSVFNALSVISKRDKISVTIIQCSVLNSNLKTTEAQLNYKAWGGRESV